VFMASVMNIFFIALLGAFIQATTGFGAPILMLAFFPHWFSYTTSVTLCHLIALASTGYLMFSLRSSIQWKTLFPVLSFSLLFCGWAAWYSVSLRSVIMTRTLGFFLVAVSLFFLLMPKDCRIRPTLRNGIITGVMAGICNGFFGISAPPTAIYLMSAIDDKNAYMGTLQTFFFFSNIESIVIRVANGSMAGHGVWGYVPIGWVAIMGGTFLGQMLFRRLPLSVLKKTVYGFVGLAGIWNVITSY